MGIILVWGLGDWSSQRRGLCEVVKIMVEVSRVVPWLRSL